MTITLRQLNFVLGVTGLIGVGYVTDWDWRAIAWAFVASIHLSRN